MLSSICISSPNVVGDGVAALSYVCLGLYNCRNIQFDHPVLHISPTEVVGRVPLAWLRQFLKPYLFLPKSLLVVLYRFGEFAQHPARFIIFA
jgi:hypothetical protein